MSEQELPAKNISQPTTARDATAKPTNEQNEASPTMPVAPALPEPDSQEPIHHCHYTCEGHKGRWDKVKPWVEAFGVALLFVYTFYTIKMYCANRDAANAATSAANTASRQLELTDRPWVSVEAFIASPVIYDGKTIQANFSFVAKNIGHSPAQNVSIAPRLIPAFMGDDVREMQRRICDGAARDKTVHLKYVLFPGEP